MFVHQVNENQEAFNDCSWCGLIWYEVFTTMKEYEISIISNKISVAFVFGSF
jgi:uncharacterized Zn finger protein